MISKSGIKYIVTAERGGLSSPVWSFRAGLRDNAELMINDFNPLKSVRNVNLTVMKNFKFSNKTFQATVRNFRVFDLYAKTGGCDAQLVAVPQSDDPKSGGVFNFVGDAFFGVMFKFLLSNKERSLNYDLECALDPWDANNLLNQSLINNPTNQTGISTADYIPPNLSSLTVNGLPVFAKDELLEWEFVIETKETEKTAYNRSKVDYYKLSLRAKGSDATITKIVTMMNTNNLSAVVLTTRYADSSYDTFTINSNVLAKREEVQIADNTRNLNVIWEAEIPLANVVVDGTFHNVTINAE